MAVARDEPKEDMNLRQTAGLEMPDTVYTDATCGERLLEPPREFHHSSLRSVLQPTANRDQICKYNQHIFTMGIFDDVISW